MSASVSRPRQQQVFRPRWNSLRVCCHLRLSRVWFRFFACTAFASVVSSFGRSAVMKKTLDVSGLGLLMP